MNYRTIPGTDLTVSLLGFGNFVFGTNWWGDFTDAQAVCLQNQAVDLGVNFFDTAPAYGNGRAESLLQPTIEYAGRDRLVISTKFGYDFQADPGESGSHRERKQDFSPAFIRDELERSLKRMAIECIDLYQAHNIKLSHFRDELFAELDKLVDAGKIRAWGVALGPAIGWREEGHEAMLGRQATTVQTVFNLYEQDPGRELCRIAAAEPASGNANCCGAVIARVPTNSGILDDEFASADHRFEDHDHRKFRDRDWLVYGLEKNRIILPMAESLGLSLRQFAMRWLASWPGLVSIEPNLLKPQDLVELSAACDGSVLSPTLMAELDRLYENDFGLGPVAHPCDLKSSTADSGVERSGYKAPDFDRLSSAT